MHFIMVNRKLHQLTFIIARYLLSRGYGHTQDKDSGGSDDDMSDDGTDDTVASNSQNRSVLGNKMFTNSMFTKLWLLSDSQTRATDWNFSLVTMFCPTT